MDDLMPKRGVNDSRLRNWARGVATTPPPRDAVAELLAENDNLWARWQVARPVLDAAEKWAEFNGSTNELLAALDAYRAASGSVEADTPAEPGRETNRFGHPVYVGDDWAVEQWSSGEIKVSVSDHRDPPGGQTYYFEPDLAAAIGAAAREVAGTPAAEPAPDGLPRKLREMAGHLDEDLAHHREYDAMDEPIIEETARRLRAEADALAGAGEPGQGNKYEARCGDDECPCATDQPWTGVALVDHGDRINAREAHHG